jgi:hypothetical protein
VEAIVQKTLGPTLQGRTARQASEISVLDPACGSGSFLIVAYQFLLDWHRDWYVQHLLPLMEKGSKPSSPEIRRLLPETEASRKGRKREAELTIYQARDGEWRLTTAERKRILLSNIYGVDIDRQAVEVTKLSLLLKVLEGENDESISKQLTLFQERALPDLGNNIKCGNSLIGWDILEDNPGLGREEIERINPFDWKREFAEVFRRGGFNVVIGNPPYVRQEMLSDSKSYFQYRYQVYHGIADLYTYFIERGVSILQRNGIFSYIVSNKWMQANYGKPLRKWLKMQHIEEILDFGDLPVFQGAATYPCIIRIVKDAPQIHFDVTKVKTLDFHDLNAYAERYHYSVNQAALDDKGWSLADYSTLALLDKIMTQCISLDEYAGGEIYTGIKPGFGQAFFINAECRQRLIDEDPKSEEVIKPLLIGRDLKRYQTSKIERYLIYIPWHFPLHDDSSSSVASDNAEDQFKKEYPAIYNHLLRFKPKLIGRDRSETGIKYEWYALQRPRLDYYREFEKPKIIYLVFQVKPTFTYDELGTYINNAVWTIPLPDKYLLGILNSKFGWFLVGHHCTQIQGGYQLIFKYFKNIPIRAIDFSDPADVARHDRMVAFVEQMLALHKQLPQARTLHEQTALLRQIEATDRQIDALVYELYGLTEEEIAIVEGSV